MSSQKIIIGTRGSALALKQADITANAIRAINPSIDIEVRIIQTHGDVNQNPIPLDTIGKGWFTKEIEDALLNGDIHLAIHSLKDMADDMPAGLHIGAYLAREDARDVLITKNGKTLEELPPGAVIGTDSSRRQIQMKALRPDVVMKSLRGNVPTRLDKLASERYDAVILAAAGLKRLGLKERITRYFEPHEMTPAPGQGILAIQTKEGNSELHELLTVINDIEAAHAAHIERSFSKMMGGGCKSPTGAYAFRDGDRYCLVGMRADSESNIRRDEMRAPWNASERLGEMLARKLLED
jgi:hydroxymethylbilane synthase